MATAMVTQRMTPSELLHQWNTLTGELTRSMRGHALAPQGRDLNDLQGKLAQMQTIFDHAQDLINTAQQTKKNCLDLKNRLFALSLGDTIFLLIGVGAALLPAVADQLGVVGKVISVACVLVSQSCSKTNDYLSNQNKKQGKDLQDLLQIVCKGAFLRLAQRTLGSADGRDLQQEQRDGAAWEHGRAMLLEIADADSSRARGLVPGAGEGQGDALLQVEHA